MTELFERERDALLQYLTGLLRSRADAEDLLQETYLRLLRTSTLERRYARARSYAYKIATHLAYDRFRKRKDIHLVDLTGSDPVTEDTGFQILSLDQCLEALKHTVLGLERRCRHVFLLRTAEGLSYEAIASRLGVSKRTVEREMKKALDTCQRALESFQ